MQKTKPLITFTDVSKSYDQTVVLSSINFTIFEGDKIGLVGPNGIGKSTIQKIIANEIIPDNGNMILKKKLKVGYLPQDLSSEAELKNLSGGEKTKLRFKNIVADNPDIYLLDEPTNNLDYEGLGKIEKFVKQSQKTFLIVSHDREFLDRTVNRIFEIDESARTLHIYEGNYSIYRTNREKRIQDEWKSYEEKSDQQKSLKNSATQRLQWMDKIERKRIGNKKLDPGEKEKPPAAMLRDMEGKMGKRAKVMKDRILRYQNKENITRPKSLLPIKMEFEVEKRSGEKVFELKQITKKLDKFTLGPISINIMFGDRILIEGPNGAGKTTLIKLILGQTKMDSGEVIIGTNVRIGYLPQQNEFDDDSNLITNFLSKVEMEEGIARRLLNRFGFPAEDMKKKLSELSSGEKSRLILAIFQATKANCLILDEPSNHLDLEAVESLEKGLRDFKGTLIVVSHDRYFIKNINLNKTYLI